MWIVYIAAALIVAECVIPVLLIVLSGSSDSRTATAKIVPPEVALRRGRRTGLCLLGVLLILWLLQR
jgi:hypothetical protein